MHAIFSSRSGVFTDVLSAAVQTSLDNHLRCCESDWRANSDLDLLTTPPSTLNRLRVQCLQSCGPLCRRQRRSSHNLSESRTTASGLTADGESCPSARKRKRWLKQNTMSSIVVRTTSAALWTLLILRSILQIQILNCIRQR